MTLEKFKQIIRFIEQISAGGGDTKLKELEKGLQGLTPAEMNVAYPLVKNTSNAITVLQFVIQKYLEDLDPKNKNRNFDDFCTAIKLLLKQGADPDVVYGSFKESLLHGIASGFVAYGSRKEAIEYKEHTEDAKDIEKLFKALHGANFNALDSDDNTAAHAAIAGGNYFLLPLLHKYGTGLNRANKSVDIKRRKAEHPQTCCDWLYEDRKKAAGAKWLYEIELLGATRWNVENHGMAQQMIANTKKGKEQTDLHRAKANQLATKFKETFKDASQEMKSIVLRAFKIIKEGETVRKDLDEYIEPLKNLAAAFLSSTAITPDDIKMLREIGSILLHSEEEIPMSEKNPVIDGLTYLLMALQNGIRPEGRQDAHDLVLEIATEIERFVKARVVRMPSSDPDTWLMNHRVNDPVEFAADSKMSGGELVEIKGGTLAHQYAHLNDSDIFAAYCMRGLNLTIRNAAGRTALEMLQRTNRLVKFLQHDPIRAAIQSQFDSPVLLGREYELESMFDENALKSTKAGRIIVAIESGTTIIYQVPGVKKGGKIAKNKWEDRFRTPFPTKFDELQTQKQKLLTFIAEEGDIVLFSIRKELDEARAAKELANRVNFGVDVSRSAAERFDEKSVGNHLESKSTNPTGVSVDALAVAALAHSSPKGVDLKKCLQKLKVFVHTKMYNKFKEIVTEFNLDNWGELSAIAKTWDKTYINLLDFCIDYKLGNPMTNTPATNANAPMPKDFVELLQARLQEKTKASTAETRLAADAPTLVVS